MSTTVSSAGGGNTEGSKATGEPKPLSPLASDAVSPLDANVPRTDTATDEERPEIEVLRSALGAGYLGATSKAGFLYLIVDREAIVEALTALRDDPAVRCDYFAECMGVDYSVWTHERDTVGRFEVVYNLVSLARNERVFVKIGVADGQTVPTAKGVFLGAEFPEREIQDLFGIAFDGNAPLPGQRFLLPDDWVGFPLRKEVPLGGEDVLFDGGDRGPAVEDRMVPHAGESWEGRTGSADVSGR